MSYILPHYGRHPPPYPTSMVNGKRPAKASKNTSQLKVLAKKQPKKMILPAPCTTHKQHVEEVSSDDESDDEPPQKPWKKRSQKGVEDNDSDMSLGCP